MKPIPKSVGRSPGQRRIVAIESDYNGHVRVTYEDVAAACDVRPESEGSDAQ